VLTDRSRRVTAGLDVPTPAVVVLRIGGLAAGVLGAVAVLDAYQGVPVALVLVVGLAAGFDVLLRRTRFGRGLIAVGGNTETARRAGIRVTRVRVAAFALCSTLAAVGGILAASRSYAVGQSSGGFDVLLMAVAAAVIGGTSLFGGRGRTYSALLGMLVLGAIQSGLLLLQLGTEARYMITAVVLLGAVALDAVARRAAYSDR
jgi:D-xylose transport system permease protein